MIDMVFSGRNVFILYLVLAGSFLQPLFPCHSTRLISDSMIIRHILGFLTLIFFVVVTDTELDDYMPLGTVLAVSAAIYVWFILSSRMTGNFWLALVFLLAALYIIDLYESRQKKEDPRVAETLGLVKNGIIAAGVIITLLGVVLYIGEKKLEYKKTFSYLTFFLGTPVCRDTVSRVSYKQSLIAAFR